MSSITRPVPGDSRVVSFGENHFTIASTTIAAESSPVAIVLTTLAAEVLYANRRFLEVFGVASVESILERDVSQACHGEVDWQFLDRLAKDGKPQHRTLRLTRAAGSVTLMCTATRVSAESGYPKWLSIALQELTEDTGKNLTSDATAPLLARILGQYGTWSIPVADARDLSHACISVSSGFSALMGWEHRCEPLPLREWLRRVHHEDRTRLRAAIASLAESGDDYVLRYRLLIGGTERLVESVARVADAERGAPYLVGIEHDVNDLCAQGDTLRLQRHLFQTLSEYQETPAFAIDPRYRLIWFNAAFAAFADTAGAQARIGDAIDHIFDDPPLRRNIQRNLRRALQGERRAQELQLPSGPSTLQRCDLTFNPIRDDASHTIGVMTVATIIHAAGHEPV
jgi:PAS domain S-box-containing protein